MAAAATMNEIPQAWPRTREEFGELVEALQDGLVGYAASRLGSQAEAEDVVQDVLVRAWLTPRPAAAFTPYVYRMLINRCIDVRRSGRLRLSAPLRAGTEQVATGETPEELAVANAEQQRIQALLERVPQREAEVLRLRVYADLSFEEIAAVTGVPLATAKSRFRYGLEKLRRLLKGAIEK